MKGSKLRGDMLIMYLPETVTTGLDGKAFCYVMLKTASSNRYRMLILAEPSDWWTEPMWHRLRDGWSPLKTSFRYEYRMCKGNLSTYTVSKKEWLKSEIPVGVSHKFAGNLFDSIEKLKK